MIVKVYEGKICILLKGTTCKDFFVGRYLTDNSDKSKIQSQRLDDPLDI